MEEDPQEHRSKVWKNNRDQTFDELYKVLLALNLPEDQVGYDLESWHTLMKVTVGNVKRLLAQVDVSDLPWSAVYNTMNGYLNSLGWDYVKNCKINSQEVISRSSIKHQVQRLADFVLHWTPKSSDSYKSYFQGKTYETRENMEPTDDLSVYAIEGSDIIPHKKLVRVLSSNFPRRVYVSLRQGLGKHERTGRHWGQRKLLMNEIELLNLHAFEDYTMVYAGAAPCTHLSIIEDMFRSIRMKYILVDPAPFHVRKSPNIQIRSGNNGLFSEKMAEEFSAIGDKLVFASDIRREHDSELQILQDMEDQMRWHLIMKPRASMFKFRLPWCKGKTPYLNGKVYIQPYAQMHSTETRLIATSLDICDWDNTIYEEQCFHFNTVTRYLHYPHGVKGAGLDENYDCAAEVAILRQYYERFDPDWWNRTEDGRNELISALSVLISESLGGQRGRDYINRGLAEDMGDAKYAPARSEPAVLFMKNLAEKREQEDKIAAANKKRSLTEEDDSELKKMKPSAAPAVAANASEAPATSKPSYPYPLKDHKGWMVCWSNTHNREYYQNHSLNKSVWVLEHITGEK